MSKDDGLTWIAPMDLYDPKRDSVNGTIARDPQVAVIAGRLALVFTTNEKIGTTGTVTRMLTSVDGAESWQNATWGGSNGLDVAVPGVLDTGNLLPSVAWQPVVPGAYFKLLHQTQQKTLYFGARKLDVEKP